MKKHGLKKQLIPVKFQCPCHGVLHKVSLILPCSPKHSPKAHLSGKRVKQTCHKSKHVTEKFTKKLYSAKFMGNYFAHLLKSLTTMPKKIIKLIKLVRT